MKKRLLCILTILVLLCTCAAPLSARGAELVDPDRKCSLKLDYSSEGIGFADLDIQIYRVAAFSADGSYGLCEPFSSLPVKIHGITSQKEWRDAANTLAAYAASQGIAPTRTERTDETGSVLFDDLQTGIYLILGVNAATEDGIYLFESFCSFLPRPRDDGSLSYHLTAKPKNAYTPKPEEPEEVEYHVVKLWKDTGDQTHRPDSITVDILKNGVLQETVTLSAANNWTYSWTAPEGDDVWTVVETDVTDGYTVVISLNGTAFNITNSRPVHPDPGGGDGPTTGDTFPLRTWLMTMCASGILLMVFGILFKRKYR